MCVCMRFFQHVRFVIVADGTKDAQKSVQNVFPNDPATGLMRCADAGYLDTKDCATENQLWLPVLRLDSRYSICTLATLMLL